MSPTPVLLDIQFCYCNTSPIEINQRSQTTFKLSGVAGVPTPDLARKSGTMYDNALDDTSLPMSFGTEMATREILSARCACLSRQMQRGEIREGVKHFHRLWTSGSKRSLTCSRLATVGNEVPPGRCPTGKSASGTYSWPTLSQAQARATPRQRFRHLTHQKLIVSLVSARL